MLASLRPYYYLIALWHTRILTEGKLSGPADGELARDASSGRLNAA